MSRFLRFFRVLFIAFACVGSVLLFRNVFAASTSTYYYTLNDDGAKTASVPNYFAIGSVSQLATLPYKPGYGYAGHYTAQNCGGTKVIDYTGTLLMSLQSSTTLYACWLPFYPPSIVFNDAGGTGGHVDNVGCYGQYQEIYVYGNHGVFSHGDVAWVEIGNRGGEWLLNQQILTKSNDYYWVAYCANGGVASVIPPTRSGYVFKGYYTGQNGTGTQVVYQDGTLVDAAAVRSALSTSTPTTVYAHWQQEYSNYLITLNDAGGSGGQVGGNAFLHLYEIYGECYALAVSQNSNGTLSGAECIQAIYATPTRTGYNFGGYYTGQNGTGQQIINASGTIVGSNTYFTSAATIHAKWTPKIYTVTLNHQSATNSPAPSTVYVKHGTGWYSNSAGTTAIYSMTTIPVRTNFNFAGYYTGTNGTGTRVIDSEGNFLWTSAAINAITSNTTIYAYWVAAGAVPNWVTVTLNDKNGNDNPTTYSNPRAIYRNTNSAVANCSGWRASASCNATEITSITRPTLTNYLYGGHYTASDGSGTQVISSTGVISTTYAPTSNVTIYAKWTSSGSGTPYTITLSANGGSGNKIIYERYNIGWFRKYNNNYYAITSSIFNSTDSGGAGLSKPTRTDYTFNGYWSTSNTSGGTQIIDPEGNILVQPTYDANQTFYARWSQATSVVTLNKNATDATNCAVTSVTAINGSPMPALSCAPTRTGYVFDGYWDETSNGVKYYNADRTSARNWDKTGAQTLYAHWQPTVYDVIYYCTKEDKECYDNDPTDPSCHAYHDVATYNQSYVFKTRAFVGCAEITGQKFFGWEAEDTGSSIQYQPGQVITYTFTSDKGLSGTYQPIIPVTLNHGNPNNTPSFDTVYLVPTDGWYSNSSATIGAIFGTLPEKYGYEFLGYWTATTGGTKVIDANGDFLVNVFDNTYPSNLYARYSEKIYTVNLNDQGATTASAPNPVAYSITRGWFNPSNNATITAITPPTKTGKYFDGFWVDLGEFNTASSGTRITDHNGNFVVNVTQDILHAFALGYMNTIYANWIDQNTVTFSCENQAGDGSGTPNPTTVQIHSGETLTFPSMANCSWGNAGYSPFLWGYVVNGGFTDTHDAGDTITWDSSWGNRTYNMWYAPNYFNYEYSCGTGTGTPPASGNTYYHSNWSTAANTCTKTGYTFAGWKEPVSNEIWPESTTPTNGYRWPYDVTAAAGGAFTAQWTASTYSISYTLNGGTAGANAPTSGTYDSVVTISNPTHAHATFTGWTVTGMDNGTTHYYGTANPPTSTTTGTSISTPTKAQYYKNLSSTSGTVAFTAVWECNAGYTGTNCNTQVQYPLTWSCGDASGTPSGASFPTTITYGGTLTFPANPCGSIVGHTFTGWVVDVNATQYNVGGTLTWPFTSGSAITAHYDPVKVNITYSCGGTGTTGNPSKTADNNIDYGSQVTLATLGTCAKAGNTATKWVVSGTNDNYDFGENVTHWNYTENKTLVPNWSAQSYNIIYKDEDGTTVLTGLTPSSYTYGTSTTINAVPTKLYSTFNGWCTTRNSSTGVLSGCQPTSNPHVIGPTATGEKVFYASWNCAEGYRKYSYATDANTYSGFSGTFPAGSCAPVRYKITCNGNGGVACLEQFNLGQSGTVGQYSFGSVYNTNAISLTGSDATGVPVPIHSTGNTQPVWPYLFTKSPEANYSSFNPWPANDDVSENVRLGWLSHNYVTFMQALANESYNSSISFGRPHYTFDGLWTAETDGDKYIGADGLSPTGGYAFDSQEMANFFTSDATVYAHWKPDVYMVSLEANGGNPGALTAVYEEYGNGWARSSLGPFGAWTQITGNEFPTRQGYTFAGYYDTSAASGGTKYINADGTLASGITPTSIGQETALYARWTVNTYDVTYTCGTGSGNVSSATATYDANFTPASGSACTNPGRSFAGWLVSGTSDTKQAGTAFQWKYTEDKTFTAQWTDNTYTITFHPGSGVTTTGTTEVQEWYSHAYRVQSGTGSMSWTAITEITLPTKTGYTFAGYYDNASFTGNPVMTDATLPATTPAATYFTADADLYAKWTAKDYTMQYLCSDGESGWNFAGTAPTATNPVHYGESVPMAANPYGNQTGCRKVWGTSGDADYCTDCFTFGGWTIDAESAAIPTAPAHAASSSVNPWGSTGGTDWCIVNTTGVCSAYNANDAFLVRPQYTPKQYDITYMYATSPVDNNASMPADYTYTVGTSINNADQIPPAHATFNGWCTGVNGTGTCYNAGLSIAIGNRAHGDITYYANWSCDTGYTLTYDTNNQPVCSADAIPCAATQYLPANATTCVDCTAGNYCPGGSFRFNETTVQGIYVCATNTYSNNVASACTACATANGYTNSGSTAADHAYESSCKTTCSAGQCVATARAACANVGVGGWATGGVVSQGSTLACNACPTGLTTVGYGTGADEADDCGRVLHLGENHMYLRGASKTNPSLHVKVGDTVFYGNMSTSLKNMSDNINKKLRLKYNDTTYSVYDDSVAD